MVCVALLSCLFFISGPSFGGEQSNMRGKRYCELIIAKTTNDIAVYNTFGLNDCPDTIWKQIQVNQIQHETGALFVRLNGPRYWVIDGFKNSALLDPTVKTFNGLEMRKAGEVLIKGNNFYLVNTPYYEREIKRHTTWIFEAGKPVYELVDSKGHVYVMQSYSTEHYPQTEQTLASLAKQLKLPPGWHFKTGILPKTVMLEAEGDRARVLRDNLLNTYQYTAHDLL